ncbi:MAG: glycosyltransferase family 2 protein [Deltaproteobacteria bacterium]|nr:glycosyltransferase family 2 protein [Deltaproteobacteria bacterium]
MTEVSVIIPTFNRAQKVARAISSVLGQTFRDFDVIVIDDGSTDETTVALEGFKDNITLIRHPENMGVSAARNSGIRASQSPFIAFLDSDDYWLPEKLETQMQFFREHTEAVACQPEEIWVRNGRRVNPWRKHIKPSGDIFKSSLKLCVVSPSAVMLRRGIFDEAGLFDEDLPVCEDYDLWLRISCRYPIHLINKYMLVKEGGHHDQLSSMLKGMDRYRIKAMVKLLQEGCLNRDQASAVHDELEKKCRIYGNGCIKRGKTEEGEFFLNLPERLKTNSSVSEFERFFNPGTDKLKQDKLFTAKTRRNENTKN